MVLLEAVVYGIILRHNGKGTLNSGVYKARENTVQQKLCGITFIWHVADPHYVS